MDNAGKRHANGVPRDYAACTAVRQPDDPSGDGRLTDLTYSDAVVAVRAVAAAHGVSDSDGVRAIARALFQANAWPADEVGMTAYLDIEFDELAPPISASTRLAETRVSSHDIRGPVSTYRHCLACHERAGDCHCAFNGAVPQWEERDSTTHQRPAPAHEANVTEELDGTLAGPDGACLCEFCWGSA